MFTSYLINRILYRWFYNNSSLTKKNIKRRRTYIFSFSTFKDSNQSRLLSRVIWGEQNSVLRFTQCLLHRIRANFGKNVFNGIVHQFWIYKTFYRRSISIKQLWLEIIEKIWCLKSVRPSTFIYIIYITRTDFEHPIFLSIPSQRCFFEMGLL